MSTLVVKSLPRFIQTSKYGGTSSIPMDPKLEKFLECLIFFIQFKHMKRDGFHIGADFFEEKFKKECSEYMGMIPHLVRNLLEKIRNENFYVFPASGIESLTSEINIIIQMLFKNEIGKNLRFFPLFTIANQKKIIWLLFRVITRLFLYYSDRIPMNGLTFRDKCYLLLFIYYRLLGRRIISITESTLYDKLQPGIHEIIHEYMEKSKSLKEETVLKIFIGRILSGEHFQPLLQKLPLQQQQRQQQQQQQMYDTDQQMARLRWVKKDQQSDDSQQQQRHGGGGGGGSGKEQKVKQQRVQEGRQQVQQHQQKGATKRGSKQQQQEQQTSATKKMKK